MKNDKSNSEKPSKTNDYTQKISCTSCQNNHYLEVCPKFKEIDALNRYEFAKKIDYVDHV